MEKQERRRLAAVFQGEFLTPPYLMSPRLPPRSERERDLPRRYPAEDRPLGSQHSHSSSKRQSKRPQPRSVLYLRHTNG